MYSVIRGRGFDTAAERLGITVREWDDIVRPLEERIAADPWAYPTEAGTDRRTAPLNLPGGQQVTVVYRVGVPYRRGEETVVLDGCVVPDRMVAG